MTIIRLVNLIRDRLQRPPIIGDVMDDQKEISPVSWELLAMRKKDERLTQLYSPLRQGGIVLGDIANNHPGQLVVDNALKQSTKMDNSRSHNIIGFSDDLPGFTEARDIDVHQEAITEGANESPRCSHLKGR